MILLRLLCPCILVSLLFAGCEDSPPPPQLYSRPLHCSPVQQEAGWQMDLTRVRIPNRVAAGSVRQKSFRVSSATVDRGILHLNSADIQFTIFLFKVDSNGVAGKSYRIARTTFGMTPHIHMNWAVSDRILPHSKIFMSDYALILEFGEEQNRLLPGRIHLSLPDDHRSFFSGTFDAKITGFRIKNGVPELEVDSFDTLKYLIGRYLDKKHPGKKVEKLNTHDFTYSKGRGVGTGWITYAIGGKKVAPTRFAFRKGPKGWRISAVLRLDQIAEAHPDRVLTRSSDLLESRAALILEQEHQKSYPGKRILRLRMHSRIADHRAIVTVGYRTEDVKIRTGKRLLFTKRDGEWRYARELRQTERVRLRD